MGCPPPSTEAGATDGVAKILAFCALMPNRNIGSEL